MSVRTVQDLINNVDTSALLIRSLSDWRPVLAEECQVYVFNETYIAKRFDQIHYKFCEKNEAKEILIDNLYALLRYKYFPAATEEIDDRITKIVYSFTANLKTTLKRVSFDKYSDANIIKMLPDYCIAFRNGVFNFKTNNWLFKYDVVKLKNINNNIYMYDPSYAIFWYFDYDFTPLDINLNKTNPEQLVEKLKDFDKVNKNYCFELVYNICHDATHHFDIHRFTHFCEILGYTVLQSFSQYFVLLIGSGQNGKNSLFDGCFTNRVIPKPASNDLDSIENDRFITGALENKAHNIFLETSAKTYTESKMIKALTGSMYQTIESKGVSKYSGVINCKYIFAGNDQDKIKFSDDTTGFRRRINMFEIFYRWDKSKKFLSKGDYFDTTFSDSLVELKDDTLNTSIYAYLAMFGIITSTDNFSRNFQFTKNDWSEKYTELDIDVKEGLKRLTLTRLSVYLRTKAGYEDGKTMMYDITKKRLQVSETIKRLGYNGYDELIDMLSDDEAANYYFADNDIYISIRSLQTMVGDLSTPKAFSQMIRKLYPSATIETIYNNKPYIKCTFVGKTLRIV